MPKQRSASYDEPGYKRSLGSLAEVGMKQGVRAARTAYEALTGQKHSERNLAVIRAGDAYELVRTAVSEDQGIRYLNYSPRPAWEPRFSVLKATFDSNPKRDAYHVHLGEEWVAPLSGGVKYHFFTPLDSDHPGQSLERPCRQEISVQTGEIAKINCRVPHHAWGGPPGAEAWMVLHSPSNSTTANDLSPRRRLPKEIAYRLHRPPRTEGELGFGVLEDEHGRKRQIEDYGRYALIAWGISDRLRQARIWAGLNLDVVSYCCDVTKPTLSRIERGETNPSVDVLSRLAEFYCLDLAALIAPEEWTVRRKVLSEQRSPVALTFDEEGDSDTIRFTFWRLEEVGRAVPVGRSPNGLSVATPSTWIVLCGRVRFGLDEAVFDTPEEALRAGDVLHVRHSFPKSIEPTEESTVLQFYSAPA